MGLEVGTCLGVGCLGTYLGGRLRFEGVFWQSVQLVEGAER